MGVGVLSTQLLQVSLPKAFTTRATLPGGCVETEGLGTPTQRGALFTGSVRHGDMPPALDWCAGTWGEWEGLGGRLSPPTHRADNPPSEPDYREDAGDALMFECLAPFILFGLAMASIAINPIAPWFVYTVAWALYTLVRIPKGWAMWSWDWSS